MQIVLWISKQTAILGSSTSHRTWYSSTTADGAPEATELGQLPEMGGTGLCLGLSGMPISGWATVPCFSWLPFVYASFPPALGQVPGLFRSPLFSSSYHEGDLPSLSFSLLETISLLSLQKRLCLPEFRPAGVCIVSLDSLPRKIVYFRQILLICNLADNLGIYPPQISY